jgi:protein tyrosine/serine phosphatase
MEVLLYIKNLFASSVLFCCIFFFPFDVHGKSFLSQICPGFLKNNEIVDNFHCVEKNALYRSGQLSVKRLEHYIRKYNIKTIINLRGINEYSSWWQKEHALAEKMNIDIYDIAMTAKQFSSKENILLLLKLYEFAPKPILIHCSLGSDRTGEASALWKLAVENKSKKEALKQLSLKYLHLKQRYPKKRSFIKMWQGINWLNNEYDPDLCT